MCTCFISVCELHPIPCIGVAVAVRSDDEGRRRQEEECGPFLVGSMSPERRLARRHERREGVIMIKVLPASTALQQQHFKSSCCCRRRIRKLHIAAAVDRKREQLAADRAQSKCQDNRLKYSCSQLNSLFEKSCFFLSFFFYSRRLKEHRRLDYVSYF